MGTASSKNNLKLRLLNAATEGNVQAVSDCLQHLQGADIDCTEQYNTKRTPLQCAAANGHVDVLKILLDSTANKNKKDTRGKTAMHMAAENGHSKVVSLLLKYKALVNFRDFDHFTPLQYAYYGGHEEVIQILLSANATRFSETAKNLKLIGAAERGDLDKVKECIDNGADINYIHKTYSSLHHSIMNQHNEIARILLRHGADMKIKDKSERTPLHWACNKGNHDLVQILLEHINNSNDDVLVLQDIWGNSPLHLACSNGNVAIVKSLLSTLFYVNCNLTNIDDKTPSDVISSDISDQDRQEILSLLKTVNHTETDEINASVEEENVHTSAAVTNAMDFDASQEEEVKMVKSCCKEINVDILDPPENLELVVAAEQDDLEKVSKCIEKGANVNHIDKMKQTPLHHAAMYGNTKVVALLMEKKADLAIKDVHGQTALHLACIEDRKEVIQVMLEMNESQFRECLKYQNNSGNTPLHCACKVGNIDAIRLLLLHQSADTINVQNRSGQRPIEMIPHSMSEIIDSLELFRPSSRKEYFIVPQTRVFMCGNPGSGKSTLAELISQYDPNDLPTNIVPKVQTQRMITTIDEGQNIVLYDFVGQLDYMSYSAALEKIIVDSPSVFILVVNLADNHDKIKIALKNWISFIDNAIAKISKPSQLIVVGNHRNSVQNTDIKKLSKYVHKTMGSITHLNLKAVISLECQNPEIKEATKLMKYLKESTKLIGSMSKSHSVSFDCYSVYASLLSKYKDIPTNLEKVTSDFSKTAAELTQLLETLSAKGLILYLKVENTCWIIANESCFWNEVTNKLFTSANTEDRVFSNTGVVARSAFEELFPNYNGIVDILKSLQICDTIDSNIVTKKTNIRTKTNVSEPSEELLYFPSLVSTEPHSKATIKKGYGWGLFYSNDENVLPNTFRDKLLLQLAYNECLTLREKIGRIGSVRRKEGVVALNRRCEVWTNGIYWKSVKNVEVTVQITNYNRFVTVVVSKCDPVEVSQLRCSVIRKIQTLLKELNLPIDNIFEAVIYPKDIPKIRTADPRDLTLIPIEEVAYHMLQRTEVIPIEDCDVDDIKLKKLIGKAEPYSIISPSVIKELFNDEKADQKLSEESFKHIQHACIELKLTVSVTRCHTYSQVRGFLNRWSLFSGKNPLNIADPALSDEEIEKLSLSTKQAALLDKTPDKRDVLDLLATVAARWRNIGDALGVSNDNLDSIDSDRSIDDKGRLSKVIQKWIEEMPSDVTWRTIIEAVRGNIVQNENKAREIEEFLKTYYIQQKYINAKTFSKK